MVDQGRAQAEQPRRRTAKRLLTNLQRAESGPGRAIGHFDLALFHDNNARETEAIPHYEAALAEGLSGEKRAECLAWLASSLHKTGRPEEALDRLREARDATSSAELMKFLLGLERRIRAWIARP